jgi:lipopolysaccharide biosynthesis glycosyltransferase
MKLCLIGAGQLFETPFFPMPDQDCMNAVLANLEFPFATIGPPDIWYKAQAVNPYLHVGTASEPILLHCTGRLKPWRLERPMVSSPDLYDRLFYHFAFLETPWIHLSRKLPRSVEKWIKDDLWSRIGRRTRRAAARLAPIIGT